MEIRTLRYFLAVAREENMTRAAELLHVTQPTLSKALKSLEEELDKKLFIRQSFSIRLTDEGMLLRERAEDLVSMADKIEKEFVSLDDIAGGELFLGLADSCLIKYIADAIPGFSTTSPAATPNRWRISFRKGSWILSSSRKNRTRRNMISCHFPRRMSGASFSRQVIRWQQKKRSGSMI